MKDYHDRWISNLERLAQERFSEAITALEAGDNNAHGLIQQWSKTLATIRQLKEYGFVQGGKSLSQGA